MTTRQPIAILTDSAALIAPAETAGLPISLINFNIIIQGQAFADVVGTEEQLQPIFDRAARAQGVFKTAQTSRFIVEEHVHRLLTQYEQIIYLCISPRLSGQYNSIKTLERTVAFKNRLFVVACYNASIGQRHLVFKALKMVQSGKSCAAIIRFIKFADRKLIWTGVLIGDLSKLRRSGRMKLVFANLLERTNLKLMVLFNSRRFFVRRKVSDLCEVILKVYQRFHAHYKLRPRLVIAVTNTTAQQNHFRIINNFLHTHHINYQITHQLAASGALHSGINSVIFTVLAGQMLE